jgi:hypothetical protein
MLFRIEVRNLLVLVLVFGGIGDHFQHDLLGCWFGSSGSRRLRRLGFARSRGRSRREAALPGCG